MPYDLTNAFPALVTATNITINANEASDLTNAFPALTTVTGTIQATSSAGCVGFASSLPVLNTVGAFFYIEQKGVGALPALTSLTTVTTELNVTVGELGTPYAFALPAFTGLTSCGQVTAGGVVSGAGVGWDNAFPNLTAATGFRCSLTGVEHVLSLMPNVTSMTGTGFDLTGTPNLTSMAGSFPALTTCSGIWVADTGLPNLTFLAGVTGMGGVGAGFIFINANPVMTSINSLSAIVGSQLSSLSVVGNITLPSTAQVVALRNNYVGEGFVGTFTNTGNGPG